MGDLIVFPTSRESGGDPERLNLRMLKTIVSARVILRSEKSASLEISLQGPSTCSWLMGLSFVFSDSRFGHRGFSVSQVSPRADGRYVLCGSLSGRFSEHRVPNVPPGTVRFISGRKTYDVPLLQG